MQGGRDWAGAAAGLFPIIEGMNISKNTAVTLQFKVTDTTGKLLDQSQEPIAYLHGGYGNTFPKICLLYTSPSPRD